ncbi:hypothetical protein DPMN_129911 [Dreissena polymorpha]|uniref:Uncharacterized protein n=1 Tax=Dreissena polymorpha TaxID=45954 RepID=A0A9D4H3P5_DREPO|nr:hypothetical protein DPMN_129911 [Dreissena polymorpha]
MEDLIMQLDAERANVEDLRSAYQREAATREELTSERNMLKEHISQERALSDELKTELEKVQVLHGLFSPLFEAALAPSFCENKSRKLFKIVEKHWLQTFFDCFNLSGKLLEFVKILVVNFIIKSKMAIF